jgi:hypothetical protein
MNQWPRGQAEAGTVSPFLHVNRQRDLGSYLF